jgi:hypothetical protein
MILAVATGLNLRSVVLTQTLKPVPFRHLRMLGWAHHTLRT